MDTCKSPFNHGLFPPQDRFHDEFIHPLSRDWPSGEGLLLPPRRLQISHKAETMQKERLIPLIVACAWFMENMDLTVIATPRPPSPQISAQVR